MIAESESGRSDRVVISGAHLDSVFAGPGINDDGSGAATQIEVAQEMAELDLKLRNKVRFIWFSGEEQGLFGSDFNAANLTKAERGDVIAMLDFDMLASPNYALLIYDGDGSEHGIAGPNGSGSIERVFQDFFDARGLYTERIPFDGRSDYDGYTNVGIPAGGIFTGAEVHKTPGSAAALGWRGRRRPRAGSSTPATTRRATAMGSTRATTTTSTTRLWRSPRMPSRTPS